MHIRFKKDARGNVLFCTLCTTGLICLYMGSYLTLIRGENQMTKRSQAWNMAIPVAEAGIEEALTQLRSTTPEVKATGGWYSKNGGNQIVKTNWLSANEKYVVGIFPPNAANGPTPVIVSEGFVQLPVSTNFISRTIRVNTKLDTYTMPGMVVVTTAKMNGNKLVIDSFNSTDPAFSTNGKYDVTKRGDNALLATLSTVTNALDLGNADVWGRVASGYTGSPPKLGMQSSVGSWQWHKDGKLGLEPGAYTDDVNMIAESVIAPFTTGFIPAPVSGVTTLATDGDYKAENLSGKIMVTGKVRLLVTKTFNVSSLTVSSNATLHLYVAAPNVDISGDLNVQGRASSFKYFGLPANPALGWPGNTNLVAGGNGQFTAMVYAPGTALTLKGGGSAVEDFSGACLVRSVSMGGHYSFHFDESCITEMVKGFVAISWDEIDANWKTILAKNLKAEDIY